MIEPTLYGRRNSKRDRDNSRKPFPSTNRGRNDATNKTKTKIDPASNTPSPFHSGHTWGECFNNARNPKHKGVGSSYNKDQRSNKRAKVDNNNTNNRNNYATTTEANEVGNNNISVNDNPMIDYNALDETVHY
mmetsp:Transcript_35586/g.50471  ORF Transcript_35586/g.50471 Transcript_35586/m.50471 type:complete len:133 (+) Transcript_35586:21-419(+)